MLRPLRCHFISPAISPPLLLICQRVTCIYLPRTIALAQPFHHNNSTQCEFALGPVIYTAWAQGWPCERLLISTRYQSAEPGDRVYYYVHGSRPVQFGNDIPYIGQKVARCWYVSGAQVGHYVDSVASLHLPVRGSLGSAICSVRRHVHDFESVL